MTPQPFIRTLANLSGSEAERVALDRQAEALAVVKALPANAGKDHDNLVEREAFLRLQLADLDVALLRIPRGPKTARHVGKLRKNRDKVDEILRDLVEMIAREKKRSEGK